MSQLLTYFETSYSSSFLPYGELITITDILSSYEPVNELEYQ